MCIRRASRTNIADFEQEHTDIFSVRMVCAYSVRLHRTRIVRGLYAHCPLTVHVLYALYARNMRDVGPAVQGPYSLSIEV